MRFGKHRVTLCFNTPEQREWCASARVNGAGSQQTRAGTLSGEPQRERDPRNN